MHVVDKENDGPNNNATFFGDCRSDVFKVSEVSSADSLGLAGLFGAMETEEAKSECSSVAIHRGINEEPAAVDFPEVRELNDILVRLRTLATIQQEQSDIKQSQDGVEIDEKGFSFITSANLSESPMEFMVRARSYVSELREVKSSGYVAPFDAVSWKRFEKLREGYEKKRDSIKAAMGFYHNQLLSAKQVFEKPEDYSGTLWAGLLAGVPQDKKEELRGLVVESAQPEESLIRVTRLLRILSESARVRAWTVQTPAKTVLKEHAAIPDERVFLDKMESLTNEVLLLMSDSEALIEEMEHLRGSFKVAYQEWAEEKKDLDEGSSLRGSTTKG